MADGLKKAAVWLGLMSDATYSEDEPRQGREEYTEKVSTSDERERAGRSATVAQADEQSASITALESRRPSSTPDAVPATRPAEADISRIITVHPRTYNEARTIGEHFRSGTPVIINLTEMDDVDAKRLVDFAAGLIFGLRVSIERVTNKVFLLSPEHVQVTAEDKARIAEGGFFNQS